MTAHAARPLAERHLAPLALPVQIEPGENCFGRLPLRCKAAAQVAETLAVHDPDIAMPRAGPQAGLAPDRYVGPAPLVKQLLHAAGQELAPGQPVRTDRLGRRMAAGGAEHEGAHSFV